MFTAKNLLDNLQYGNNEEQCFKNICLTLGKSYDDAKEELLADGNSLEELEEHFGKNNAVYLNTIDRVVVLQEQIHMFISSHPTIILDKEAFRLAGLASGFLDLLGNHLVRKANPNEDV